MFLQEVSSIKIIDNVEEMGGGGLNLIEGDRYIQYKPVYDYDQVSLYQQSFYEARLLNGGNVKSSFVAYGYDWFPSSITLLHWNFFLGYIKYKPLVDGWLDGRINFKKIGNGSFLQLLEIFGYQNKNKFSREMLGIFQRIVFKIVYIRNCLIATGKKKESIFLRESVNDFRSSEIYLQFPQADTTGLVLVRYFEVIKLFFMSNMILVPGTNHINHKNKFINLELKHPSRINDAAFKYLKKIVASNIYIYSHYKKILRKNKFKKFVGMDDCNYAYPLIYAAKFNSIPTFGIQHARYTKNLENYVMNGVLSYEWYDNLIVWGSYWKDIFLKYNQKVNNLKVLVGSNKHAYDFKQSSTSVRQINRNVLLIYEFIADNFEIAEYIKKLIDCEYSVIVKVRSDDPVAHQLKSYGLTKEYESKLKFSDKISGELIDSIVAIIGSLSTLLYELIPYRKPIFVIKTNIDLIGELVDIGYASYLTLSDCDNFQKKIDSYKNLTPRYQMTDIWNDKKIYDVIKNES
jgi:hypothetical protein